MVPFVFIFSMRNLGLYLYFDFDVFCFFFTAAPRWTTEAPEASKTIAGNGSLTCDVFAHPAPSFKWYKNGKQIFVST